ncbi:uncharacterized protein LOC119571970 [Penaeus monodon]|uniref:uncharacterized protein LOC119571970 n=1 Tax=Penaeus monodon TaxID=6687 RepID=UPI0018A71828|nr:uncharacterized protein LOC119571970 [Penaeus monodon]
MIYQEEVRRQRGWDEELSSQNSVKWNAWLSELRELEGFCVNRCIVPMNLGKIGSVQLHHFCDASTKAFAAASYLRIQDVSGITHCALMLARTRLAPIKTTTIPRLELSAAVLAATSDAKLRKELSLPIDDSVFWTDSTIVLQYIKNTSRRFHTFVANRVGIIHKNSSPQQWRHVRSELNTADPASRGLSAIELMQRKDWKEEAEFLLLPETSWPLPPELPGISNDDPEVKNMTISFAAGAIKVAPVDPLFERYSSWYKLQRIVAWLRRFCSACRKKCSHQDSNLSVMEVQAARMVIIRQVQMTCFAEELDILKKRKNLKDHPVTTLIVQDIHVFHARHSGREHTLAELRRKYWIVAVCKRHTEKRFGCVFTCFSTRAVHIEPLKSLDASTFLNALMCFIARRGTPMKIYSDRGTNFLRAEKELRATVHAWSKNKSIDDTCKQRGIEWVFQPPAASHMGGVWERQIRTIRKILSSIIGMQRIDDDRLRTLFFEVEATMNSRPITAIPGDVTEPEALTPNHALRMSVGDGIQVQTDDNASLDNTYGRAWIHAQVLADRNQWRLGRVTEAIAGEDGLVRKAKVRTSSGVLVRPIVKLCLLEASLS